MSNPIQSTLINYLHQDMREQRQRADHQERELATLLLPVCHSPTCTQIRDCWSNGFGHLCLVDDRCINRLPVPGATSEIEDWGDLENWRLYLRQRGSLPAVEVREVRVDSTTGGIIIE